MVVMIDDNPQDADLIEMAFAHNERPIRFHHAVDGLQGIKLLTELLNAEGGDLPRLIIIDVNMPRIRGPEVLAFIKNSPRLAQVPVVMLSSSDAPKERALCLALGATRYLVKPLRLEDIYLCVAEIALYLDDPAAPLAAPLVDI